MNILEEITRSKREELTVRKGMVTHAELAGSRYFRQPQALDRILRLNVQKVAGETLLRQGSMGRPLVVAPPAGNFQGAVEAAPR